MRLRIIYELNINKAIRKMGPLLKTMPKKKQKHSKRVAKNLHKAGVGKSGVYAGLLHDYLERGGNILTLAQHINNLGLPQKIVNIVQNLSDDEKFADAHPNRPLAHLQEVLPAIDDDDIKNLVILAKLSDRLDNLKKRLRKGKIGKNYRRKSADLVRWLVSQYTGESNPLSKLLKGYTKTGI